MTSTVYRVVNLVKRYPSMARPANDDLNFEIDRGEIFGILGANGAGKSTLVRQMVNLLRPTSGFIELFGRRLDADAPLRVGYMPQRAEALNRLTVGEALYYTAHLRGLSRDEALRDRDAQIARWDLQSIRAQDSATLSGGQRRLLRLAVAVSGSPEVVILDEPTADLDPVHRMLVWEKIREISQAWGTTVVFITHDAVEAEKVVDRVAILGRGRLAAIGRPAALKQLVGRELRIDIRFPPSHPPRAAGDTARDERLAGRWVLYKEWRDAVDFFARLDPTHVEDIRITMPTLEDVFMHHADETEKSAVHGSIR